MKRTLSLILILFLAACSNNKPPKTTNTPDAIMEERTADRLLNQKQCTDAITAYQAYLKKFPEDADAQDKLGLAYICDNKPELAIPIFQAVLAKNPTYTDVHNNLGVAYMMMKNYPEAQKQFRIALQDNSYPVTGPYYNLAKLAYVEGSYEESRALAKKLISLVPKEAGPRVIYSMSLDKLGRDDEAIPAFKDLLQIAPESLEGNYYFAEVLMKNNQPCQARAYYTKVIDIDPIGELGQKSIAALKTIKCPK
jgi:tetratricopeptide (TPR) repeat protein